MMPSSTGSDVFPRNSAADNLVLDHDPAALFARLDGDDRMAILAASTRLTDKFAFAFGRLR